METLDEVLEMFKPQLGDCYVQFEGIIRQVVGLLLKMYEHKEAVQNSSYKNFLTNVLEDLKNNLNIKE